MRLFDKIKNGINPEADPAYDDADLYTQQIQNDFQESQMYNTQQTQTQQQYIPQDQYAAPGQDDGMQVSGSSLELKVVKPERFDNVPQIANHLLNRRTVVLNLENTNKDMARRIIDFLSGVAYANRGKIKKVATSTFIIIPNNVDLTGDDLLDAQPGRVLAHLGVQVWGLRAKLQHVTQHAHPAAAAKLRQGIQRRPAGIGIGVVAVADDGDLPVAENLLPPGHTAMILLSAPINP